MTLLTQYPRLWEWQVDHATILIGLKNMNRIHIMQVRRWTSLSKTKECWKELLIFNDFFFQSSTVEKQGMKGRVSWFQPNSITWTPFTLGTVPPPPSPSHMQNLSSFLTSADNHQFYRWLGCWIKGAYHNLSMYQNHLKSGNRARWGLEKFH